MATLAKSGILKDFADDQLTDIILPFWQYRMPDLKHGGFYGEIDHYGNIDHEKPKGLILNARILWAFSAVYAKTLKPEYLILAERAYKYILEKFRDPEHPGYFWSLNPDGSLKDGKKQIYAQAFIIYAFSEYSAASGADEALRIAVNLMNLIEEKALDNINNGYFEAFTREWTELEDLRLSDIDLNEKKTMNTHLHIIEAYTRLYKLYKDEGLKNSIENLLVLFRDKFIDHKTFHLQLFFDEYWEPKSSAISFGHDIEASWLLQEAAETISDKDLTGDFNKLAVQICEAVIPAINPEGGLIHEADQSASHHSNELEWWAQAEAIVGFINAYKISGNQKYLDLAVRISHYIEKYFIDRKNGEWFYRVDHDGNEISYYEKAGFWKCPYHTVRMCLKTLNHANLTG